MYKIVKLLAINICFLISIYTYGQRKCSLKLIDSYSYAPIKIDNSYKISNRKYFIDTSNNLIHLKSTQGKHLKISSSSYDLFDEKINLKKYKNDTISIRLKPKDSLISIRFHEIWDSDNLVSDTLQFDTKLALEKYLFSYLNYLTKLDNQCDNGLCNYSNTYRYKIEFTLNGSVYKIGQIVKLQPLSYHCDELEKYLARLNRIFPKFILNEKIEKLSFQFIITI